ncbi:putative phage head-tail adaptor [[Clostridium] sordellii]|uniref:phage head closure protein n=1 Tax=Paraclostridium sordellii TaxID=1505 RepID=UPI0005E375A7|nr:phage head closure protein [Paeniclostridium sordellii]CEN31031.1 putative phage head-tail adaptor [[Clostridium] sordellii] [Paeniclostridium sordellii]CEN87300.1 putative phage head-tail adaptor [[Clostridium] sordellii] [Paeniclostridium sordellii]CEQ08622.1 putative phage head-tail adaptor [[Clostridium] sordellii] [Paeniclostridium sordellii]
MAECRLTERIKIEKLSDSKETNENGFDEEVWKEHYKCWSGYKSVSGKEYIAAKANNSENIVTFTVRYCNKVKELLDPGASKIFRIEYKGFYYDILDVLDFENRHEFVDIKSKINC